MKHTIAFFTGNRAEWGLLKPLAERLQEKYNVKVIACASHFSCTYSTFVDIISDFDCERIENSLDSDTKNGCCKSSGILFINLPDVLDRVNPDFVVVLGDRYESMVCAFVCHIMGVKTIHLHGGEKSGNIDNAFRDCISRLAYIHCAATEISAISLVNLGYDNVYYAGALGCVNLPKANNKNSNILTVLYHPITQGEKENFDHILDSIWGFCKTKNKIHDVHFVLPNNDFGNREIREKIETFKQNYLYINSHIHVHLKREDFLKLLSKSLCVIGNSSCGIIEAPAIGIYTLNIGFRQNYREKASSIITTYCCKKDILNGFSEMDKNNFKPDLSDIPYRDNNVIENIFHIIDKEFNNDLS